MYKWMQRLVGLGAVVAEDRFSALNWEHWQWKLFPLSKRTCRSFSGVWKLFVTVQMTKDFSDTRWMIAEWEHAISFSVCCTLVGNGKVDSVSTFNWSGSDWAALHRRFCVKTGWLVVIWVWRPLWIVYLLLAARQLYIMFKTDHAIYKKIYFMQSSCLDNYSSTNTTY